MKHTSILLLLLCMSFISAAQPTFSAHYVPGAGLESISATIMRNSDEWLIYTASGKLYRTTNAGAAYDFVVAFPPSTGVRKFVNVGDTIIGVGLGIIWSADFGQTWMSKPVASGGEIYDNVVVMPGGKLWLSGCKNLSNNLYETNTSMSGYTLKYTVPTPVGVPLTDRLRHISTFSTDTVYFITNDTAAIDYGVHYTCNAGASWSYRRLRMDSLYRVMGDTSSTLSGSYRVSYVKYHNGRQANIFTVSSHATKDFVTTNGFANVAIDTSATARHDAHQVIDWIACDDHQYIAFDNNENSNPGLQEVGLNTKSMVLLGQYYPGQTVHMSHAGDRAVAGTVDMLVTKIQGICGPTSGVSDTLLPVVGTYVTPNPSTGVFHINHSNTSHWSWRVYDIAGRNIAGGTCYQPTVDLTSFTNGIYLLRLSDGNATTIYRLVKE